MAVARIKQTDIETPYGEQAFQDLQDRRISAVIIFHAFFQLRAHNGKRQLIIPWLDQSGGFRQADATTIGGTVHLPDMPPHVDPHPEDRLDVLAMTFGRASARFVTDVPKEMLDDTNEISEADMIGSGLRVDMEDLKEGDIVCFYGATTLHQLVSNGLRESFTNRYAPSLQT